MTAQALCRYAEGTNSVTGVDTRKSLGKRLREVLRPNPEAGLVYDACQALGRHQSSDERLVLDTVRTGSGCCCRAPSEHVTPMCQCCRLHVLGQLLLGLPSTSACLPA